MRKKILTSMLLLSTTLFAMDHSNHNMQHHNTNEVSNQNSSFTIPANTKFRLRVHSLVDYCCSFIKD